MQNVLKSALLTLNILSFQCRLTLLFNPHLRLFFHCFLEEVEGRKGGAEGERMRERERKKH